MSLHKAGENILAILTGFLAVPIGKQFGYEWMLSGFSTLALAIITGMGGYIGKEIAIRCWRILKSRINNIKNSKSKR